MKILVLISLVAYCQGRPSASHASNVEIQKQELLELPKNTDMNNKEHDNTRSILQKIAQINLHQLLKAKNLELPHDPQESEFQGYPKTKQMNTFDFPKNPYTNPVFDYLQKEQENKPTTKQVLNNDDFGAEDSSGSVKRKVTHQQTVIMPTYPPDFPTMPQPYYQQPYQQMGGSYGLYNKPYLGLPLNQDFQPPMPQNVMNYWNNPGYNYEKPLSMFGEPPQQPKTNMTEEEQAKENYLINNIKSIIAQKHNAQYSTLYNPAMMQQTPFGAYPPQPYTNYPYYPNLRLDNLYSNYLQPPPLPYDSQLTDTYFANLQSLQDPQTAKLLSPYPQLPSTATPKRFLQNIFPIIVKNPLPQIFNALTSMVEYGPDADPCNDFDGNVLDAVNENKKSDNRKGKNLTEEEITTVQPDLTTEMSTTTESLDSSTIMTIEDLKIIGNGNEARSNDEADSNIEVNIDSRIEEGIPNEDKGIFSPSTTLDRENMGNGIFIHKIKVRKGGVAIAGPGGIATAGNGGTAIVGPNGWALTQPNGVAIAGPGAKVFAVDPQLDLNHLAMTIKKGDLSTPRLGKVVATGPIIYRNIGQD